ncbi:MAG: Na+/H+ antiporter subunit E [bacterium]|nr:Na+/H+ antiporter subunit E [bacterium]
MKFRLWIVLRLVVRFVFHSIASGITTARIILQGKPPPSGLVYFRFSPMSETGAAVLGALVTLTPGSTTIDIDMERREMLLHFLDTRFVEAGIEAIRRGFEKDIRMLFPENRP